MSQENLETPIVTWGEHTVTLQMLLSEMKYQTSWHLVRMALQRLVIGTLFEQHNIEVTDDQIVEKMDAFREENGLYSEEEITQWLNMRALDDEEFYDFCAYEAKLDLLKEKLVPDVEINKAFAFKKLELDSVELYHIIVPTIDLAEEILEVTKEGSDFFSMAKKFSTDEDTNKSCGYMGYVARADLRPEIAAAAFSAQMGAVIGPFKGTRGFHLYLVDEYHPAELDDSTRAKLVDELFYLHIQKTSRAFAIEYAFPISMSGTDDESDKDSDEEPAEDSDEESDDERKTQSLVTEQ